MAIDLTLGIWRRLYSSGLTEGRRINTVSQEAALFFVYLVTTADDYGNAPADPRLMKSRLFPLRDEVTPATCSACLEELTAAELVERYEVAGEAYVHVRDFESRQPTGYDASRNRKPRIRRVPEPALGEAGGKGRPSVALSMKRAGFQEQLFRQLSTIFSADARQRRSDASTAKTWLDLVLPDDVSEDELDRRREIASTQIDLARANGDRPMAYASKLLKRHALIE